MSSLFLCKDLLKGFLGMLITLYVKVGSRPLLVSFLFNQELNLKKIVIP
jgi:hypothetical protein